MVKREADTHPSSSASSLHRILCGAPPYLFLEPSPYFYPGGSYKAISIERFLASGHLFMDERYSPGQILPSVLPEPMSAMVAERALCFSERPSSLPSEFVDKDAHPDPCQSFSTGHLFPVRPLPQEFSRLPVFQRFVSVLIPFFHDGTLGNEPPAPRCSVWQGPPCR